jgi:hypothetical protein
MLGLVSRAARLGLLKWATAPLPCPSVREARFRDPATPLVMFSSPICLVHSLSPSPACFQRGPDVATFRGILPLAALFRSLFREGR